MEEIRPTIRPTIKQHKAWEALQDKQKFFVFFGGAAGGGKSWLICEWLMTASYQYPGSKLFIARAELKRLMASTYVTFQKVLQHYQIPASHWHLNGQYNYIENTQTGSRIDLLDVAFKPSDPLYERLGSLEYTMGAIEEAGEVPFLAFDVLKSRVGRHKNKEYSLPPKMLLTGNPKKNWTYQQFYKPNRDGTLPADSTFIQALYNDNPHTAKEYKLALQSMKDKASKERLMYGNWEYDDNPALLIQTDAISDLFSNVIPETTVRSITVDVARFGKDKTVVMIWEGLKVIAIFTYEKQGTHKTAGCVRDISKQYGVPYSRILIDEDGIGGGVVDQMYGVKGFTANSAPLINPNWNPQREEKENYESLKAQCGYLLAEYVNARKMAVDIDREDLRERITEDLEVLQSKDVDSERKLGLLPKKDLKELLGRSPDYGDCMLMRMYFELSDDFGAELQTPEERRAIEAENAMYDKFTLWD